MYVDPLESLGTGTGEQGNRGTGVKRKRPAVPFPDDFTPTDTHLAKAEEKGLDVSVLVEDIRLWAKSKDEHKQDWNSAFSRWINNTEKKPSNSIKRVIAGGLWEGD
jgi:hypothetical protein